MRGQRDARCGFCSQGAAQSLGREVSVEIFSSLDHDLDLYDYPDFGFSFMLLESRVEAAGIECLDISTWALDTRKAPSGPSG